MLTKAGLRMASSGNRQLHHEAGSDRLILLHSNGTVMIFNDAADNGQP